MGWIKGTRHEWINARQLRRLYVGVTPTIQGHWSIFADIGNPHDVELRVHSHKEDAIHTLDTLAKKLDELEEKETIETW